MDSLCSLQPCSQAPSFCRKASQSGYGQGEVSFRHIYDVHSLTAILGCGTNWSHGNECCCKRNQTTQHCGCWLFNSYDFSPPWVLLRRSRDVREVLGPHPAVAEEPQAWFPRAVESRQEHWSEALAGGAWGWTTQVRGGDLWDKRTFDTGTVPLHGWEGSFPFPSSLLTCSPHLLMLNLFPLGSHSAPGRLGMGWRRVLDRNWQLLSPLHGHTHWPFAPWGWGTPLAEHLPLCHFWFWSTRIYLKSPQMPL